MKAFPELTLAQSIVHSLSNKAQVEELAQIPVPGKKGIHFPMYGITLGSKDPKAPVFGITGGVHGLERIGSQVVLSFLVTLVERLRWDETLQRDLEKIRLAFVPIVNPVGMWQERRSNPNGVDLMRNAPIEAEDNVSWMVGGQRISNKLPWYRGKLGDTMEIENQALTAFVRRESFQSDLAVWLDVHSGYGVTDRVWFPYAKSHRPFPHLSEAYKLKKLMDQTHPNHVYLMEPQSREYTTHGDVWDYLYEERRSGILATPGAEDRLRFMPLTLEMGSWIWIRKNPFQIFSFLGPFNPMKPHRKKRTLRRHLPLLDFLMRATISNKVWADPDTERRGHWLREAQALWYTQS